MKDGFKLLKNFIILSIPLVILCIYTAICPMYYMAVEYSMWQEEKEYVKAGKDADVLILGDSRAKSGIIPQILGDGGSLENDSIYNAAIGGATPIEMYYAYQTYLKNHVAPKKAIIIFAPYHMCDIDNWEQTLYYNYLNPYQEALVYKDALRFSEDKIAYKWALCSMLSYKLRFPNKYLSAQYNAGFVGRYQDNIDKKNSVIMDLGYTEFGKDAGNSGLSYEVHHEIFDYSDMVVFYYEKLLDLMEKSGTEVYIIQSPVNEESFAAITEDFKDGYAKMLKSITDNKGFYVETELFPYEDKYFGDNNHLNRMGAEKFTTEIKDKLNNCDIMGKS